MRAAPRWRGLGLAAAIVTAWALGLGLLLRMDPARLCLPLLLLAVLLQGLLHTGLFIVGHDAMHGLLLPGRPRWNHRLGAFVLALYAALPYGPSRRNHQRHHRAPGSALDPDFRAAGGGTPSPLGWYLRFLGGYLSLPQMLRLLAAWGVLALLASPRQVLLACTLPLLLSSVQLFLVGTYLPHRRPAAAGDPHHAVSLDLPPWLSLLACYHFGYHREHHAEPHLAWYELPSCRARGRKGLTIGSAPWILSRQTGRTRNRPWPGPPLPWPTNGPSMG